MVGGSPHPFQPCSWYIRSPLLRGLLLGDHHQRPSATRRGCGGAHCVDGSSGRDQRALRLGVVGRGSCSPSDAGPQPAIRTAASEARVLVRAFSHHGPRRVLGWVSLASTYGSSEVTRAGLLACGLATESAVGPDSPYRDSTAAFRPRDGIAAAQRYDLTDRAYRETDGPEGSARRLARWARCVHAPIARGCEG